MAQSQHDYEKTLELLKQYENNKKSGRKKY